MMNLIHSAFFTVELAIPANAGQGTQIFFKDVPELRNKFVHGLAIFTSATSPSAATANITPNGRPTTPALNFAYLTLATDNFQFVDNVPAQYFNTLQFSQPERLFTPRKITFERSFITLQSNANNDTSVLITFFYQK